jgi:hypothetical protein
VQKPCPTVQKRDSVMPMRRTECALFRDTSIGNTYRMERWQIVQVLASSGSDRWHSVPQPSRSRYAENSKRCVSIWKVKVKVESNTRGYPDIMRSKLMAALCTIGDATSRPDTRDGLFVIVYQSTCHARAYGRLFLPNIQHCY